MYKFLMKLTISWSLYYITYIYNLYIIINKIKFADQIRTLHGAQGYICHNENPDELYAGAIEELKRYANPEAQAEVRTSK